MRCVHHIHFCTSVEHRKHSHICRFFGQRQKRLNRFQPLLHPFSTPVSHITNTCTYAGSPSKRKKGDRFFYPLHTPTTLMTSLRCYFQNMCAFADPSIGVNKGNRLFPQRITHVNFSHHKHMHVCRSTDRSKKRWFFNSTRTNHMMKFLFFFYTVVCLQIPRSKSKKVMIFSSHHTLYDVMNSVLISHIINLCAFADAPIEVKKGDRLFQSITHATTW